MKKKHLKASIFCAFLCLAIMLLAAIPSFASRPIRQDGVFVYDEAELIDDETEKDMNKRATALSALTGCDLIVICVHSTDGKSTRDYTTEIFSDWHLGSSDKANGIVLVISADSEDYWTLQGAGIKRDLTDSAIQAINDQYLEPDFDAGNYGAGVVKTFNALLSKVEQIYSVDVSSWDASQTTASDTPKDEGTSAFSLGKFFKVLLIIALIVAGIFAAVTVFAFARRPRFVGTGGAKRRHYKTERGAYVSMPSKSDIERARRNSARPNDARIQQNRAAQSRAPQGMSNKRPGYDPRTNAQRNPAAPNRNNQNGSANALGNRRQRPHEHPTVYPERAPYIDKSNAQRRGGAGNGRRQ